MQLRRLPLVIFKSSVSRGRVHTPPTVSRLLLTSAALATLVSGCAYGSVRQVLRAQFASDVDCSAVKIKKRDFWYISDNPHQYKISGCGVMRTYTCTQEDADGLISYDEPACKWEDGDADAPKPKLAVPSAPMDEPMEYEGPSMDDPMDEPMDDMDEPASDSDSGGDLDADVDLDAEGAAPKGKAKAKAKGGLRLGSD